MDPDEKEKFASLLTAIVWGGCEVNATGFSLFCLKPMAPPPSADWRHPGPAWRRLWYFSLLFDSGNHHKRIHSLLLALYTS
eukprot:COSAG02_NODE_5833_length_4004_cov_2.279641_2_plen_81_part_00